MPDNFSKKCPCGYEWKEEAIMKGFETDEGGEFFRCPVDSKTYDGWNNCLGYVSPESGYWPIFITIKDEFIRIKEVRRIKKLQDGNRLLEEFL